MPLPPGPPGILRPSLRFYHRPLNALVDWHALYGDMFTVRYMGFGEGVYCADPLAIKDLFTGDQSDLHAGDANSFLTPILGPKSVLVLDGPEHLRQRKLLLSPFQGSAVATFREIIRDAAEREVARWPYNEEFAIRPRMRDLTFEVIAHAVFGVTEPWRVERLRKALTAVIDMGILIALPDFVLRDFGSRSPGGKFLRRKAAADALIYEEIALRRGEEDLEERTDVLSLLMRARDDEGRQMTDSELRDELLTMLAAGHETTATALAFAFDLLLHNPEALERVRDSLGTPDADAELDAVVKETMRFRPIIDAAERTLTKPRNVAGWDLPAGVKVYPAIALVHRRPDLYDRPLEFRPRRFLEEGAESYAWLPFGGGIRRCIGAALAQAEMAEVLRVVLQNAELQPAKLELAQVTLKGITLAPVDGTRVRRTAARRAPAPTLAGRTA